MSDWSNVLPFVVSSTSDVPEKSGLYVFYDKSGSIVYIGETGDLRRRFQEYLRETNPCVTKHANRFSYRLEPNHLRRKSEEEALIRKHSPKCNVEYNR